MELESEQATNADTVPGVKDEGEGVCRECSPSNVPNVEAQSTLSA